MPHWIKRMLAAAGGGTLLAGTLVLAPAIASAGTNSTLYVSPHGSSHNSGQSCATAKYSKIGDAVSAAHKGSTVQVCSGTYREAVMITKSLTLMGNGATINAWNVKDIHGMPAPGILILASNVTVQGFTVENSTGEGILAMTVPNGPAVSHVLITDNLVKHNDLGGPTSAYIQCQPQGDVPGDCGEGVHLMGVANSWVRHNDVTDNSGGILLSDDVAPNHGNHVVDNWVHGNQADCGITLPSHVPGDGVYDNEVRHNLVTGNGLKGEGAGILIAAVGPNMKAYDNLVIDNDVWGNGMAGVTIHSHSPGQNLSGNMIIGNRIGRNNLTGDPDASDPKTTGVLVFSAVVNVTVTIKSNTISNNTYGVWLSKNVMASNVAGNNTFHNVMQKVHIG